MCCGRTPMQTLIDGKQFGGKVKSNLTLAHEKLGNCQLRSELVQLITLVQLIMLTIWLQVQHVYFLR